MDPQQHSDDQQNHQQRQEQQQHHQEHHQEHHHEHHHEHHQEHHQEQQHQEQQHQKHHQEHHELADISQFNEPTIIHKKKKKQGHQSEPTHQSEPKSGHQSEPEPEHQSESEPTHLSEPAPTPAHQSEPKPEQELVEILQELEIQGCPKNLLEELEKILKGFIEKKILLPRLFLSFKIKGFHGRDEFVQSNMKDIDFVIDPSTKKSIIAFMNERKYEPNTSNNRNPTFIVCGINVEFMVKSQEELRFETNLWHLFLFKMLRRMKNPALKGLRISRTEISFEYNDLVFKLSNDFSSLMRNLGFTTHVFPSVVEMANAFLNSPILKDEITDELLFKLIISLFRKSSHRHFFAFIQQLMLQSNSKYQLRTEDGKTWSLLEQNESGDFKLLHTLREMDNKQVEPPLGPEVAQLDRPSRYSYEMLWELKSQQVLLQKLIEKQERLPCEELNFHVDFEEFVTMNQQITEKLQDFSYENFVSRLIQPPISMKKFFRNPEPVIKQIQLTATEMKRKPEGPKDSYTPFERLSEEELQQKLAEKKKLLELSPQEKKSDFEDIVRSFQEKANAHHMNQLTMVYERLSEQEFGTRINQSTKESFDDLVENIKQLCCDVDSLPELQEQKLLIFNQVRQILDSRPEYANINASKKKRMIDEALQALGQ
jgi:hypothetical protein